MICSVCKKAPVVPISGIDMTRRVSWCPHCGTLATTEATLVPVVSVNAWLDGEDLAENSRSSSSSSSKN